MVYAARTRDLLFLGEKPRETKWVEDATEDDVSWEVKRFLTMAIHCDPNVIEVFVAPITHNSPWSQYLKSVSLRYWPPPCSMSCTSRSRRHR